MYINFAIATLLASHVGCTAVLRRDLYNSELMPIPAYETVSASQFKFADRTLSKRVNAPGARPDAGSGKHSHGKKHKGQHAGSKSQNKHRKGNNHLKYGYLGDGHPGHSQRPGKKQSGHGNPQKQNPSGHSQPQQPKPTGQSPPQPSASKPSSSGGSSGGQKFTGDITYYTPGLGSCGVTNTESDMIVALAADMMEAQDNGNPNANPLCGKSITISHGGVTATAKIEDTCPGCSGAGLDLTPALFQRFADLGVGRVSGVQWWYN